MDSPTKDPFMHKFKMLKKRKPAPDLSGVIDFYTGANVQDKAHQVVPVDGGSAHGPNITELIPVEKWQIYELNSVPGAYFLCNPFTAEFRRYLIARCLSDYPLKPNITNLDAVGRKFDNLWQSANHPTSDSETAIAQKEMRKLRWTTLGYHYDWTKKIYDRDLLGEFPPDLSYISKYIIDTVLGSKIRFTPEAAIVNYYHLDSSLSGHTDHSEFDLMAPLISISFGLPCVFMIGGQTKSLIPEALYLRDGDIIIMSGTARLSYHAVPKVLPSIQADSTYSEQTTEAPSHNNSSYETASNGHHHNMRISSHVNTSKGSRDSIVESEEMLSASASTKKQAVVSALGDESAKKRPKSERDNADRLCTGLMEKVADNEFWEPFEKYLETSRININIRQMFAPGKGPNDYVWPTIDPHQTNT